MNRRGYLYLTATEGVSRRSSQEARRISASGAGPLRVHAIAESAYMPLQPEGFEHQPIRRGSLVGQGIDRERIFPMSPRRPSLPCTCAGPDGSAPSNWACTCSSRHAQQGVRLHVRPRDRRRNGRRARQRRECWMGAIAWTVTSSSMPADRSSTRWARYWDWICRSRPRFTSRWPLRTACA